MSGRPQRGARATEPAAAPLERGEADASPPPPSPLDREAESPPRSVIAALRAIQAGELAGASLDAPSRRACVEHLSLEGYSMAEIAEALKVSDRTVARDRAAIREANELRRDPRLAGQMAGGLTREAEASMARLRRLARDKAAPAAARVEAERAAFAILAETIRLLQRLGYLPMAAQQFTADLTHRGAAPPDLAELESELARVERIQVDSGVADGPAMGRIAEARRLIERMSIAGAIDSIRDTVDSARVRQGADHHDQ